MQRWWQYQTWASNSVSFYLPFYELWMLLGDAIQSLRRLLDIHLWVDQHIQDYDRITWFSHTPYTDPSKASIWDDQSDALGSISLEAASFWFILCILYTYTWNLFVLYFWDSTLQKMALYNIIKVIGVPGTYIFPDLLCQEIRSFADELYQAKLQKCLHRFSDSCGNSLVSKSFCLDPLRDSLLDYWLTNSQTCFWFSWLASLFVHSSIPRFGGNNWFRCGTEHLRNLAVKRSLAM